MANIYKNDCYYAIMGYALLLSLLNPGTAYTVKQRGERFYLYANYRHTHERMTYRGYALNGSFVV